MKYGVLLAGCMLITYLGLFLKKITPYVGEHVILRPDDAYACNLDKKVSNKGDVGMPSNHSMTAGFLFITLCKKSSLAYLLLLLPLSRLRDDQFPIINHGKHACHTWGQVSVGFLIGMICGKSYNF